MTDLVEIVARGIFNGSFHPYDVENGVADEKWKEWPEDVERSRKQALTALAAIKDAGFAVVPVVPTGDMVSAGLEILLHNSEPWMPAVKNTYTAMIQAAG